MLVAVAVTAFLVTVFVTPIIAAFAVRHGFVALPSPRGVHVRPTPVLGGIAIALGALFGAGIGRYAFGIRPSVPMLVCAAIATSVGTIDDRWSLDWQRKLSLQMAIAVAYVLVARPLPGLGAWGAVAAVTWLVLVMNAMNFADVSDGLAAGTTTIAAGAFAVLVADNASSTLAIAVCGAAFGFFVHNFPSGAVFMGESGSLSLGFIVGALALKAADPGPFSVAPLLALVYPLFDVAFVIVSRLRRRVPIVQGGRDHTVHRIASGIGNMRLAVTLLLLATLLMSLSAIWIA